MSRMADLMAKGAREGLTEAEKAELQRLFLGMATHGALLVNDECDEPKPEKYTVAQKAILLSLGLGEDEGWEFHGDDRRPTRPSTWQEFCKRSYEARRRREADADAEFLKACGIKL